MCGVARVLPSAAGLLLEKEIAAFGRVLDDPARPLVAILGGAKVSDKLPVVTNLLERCDAILIGGGMAYTFLKAKGIDIGGSLLEEDLLETCKRVLAEAPETLSARLEKRRRTNPNRRTPIKPPKDDSKSGNPYEKL